MATPLTAGVFPGQGSQSVGMGSDLVARYPAAKATFAEADDVLGFALSAICFEGPADELKRTSVAQPALLTASTAYWRVLREAGFTCEVAAGHSLGEYSALTAAGALSFPDALRLVRRRGEVMEEAAAAHPGGMAAIIGLEDEEVAALCAEIAAEHGLVAPANYNAPGQVVVSGVSEAVQTIRTAAKERGARAIPLAVSGPFHSPLMQPAAEAFAGVLRDAPLAAPSMPILPNVTAQPTTDPAAIRDALARQITGAVQWTRTLRVMHDLGVRRFVEIGPGNVLAGLVQRTLPDATIIPISELLPE